MLTKRDIQRIIDECRMAGNNGLGNGKRGTIDELVIDFLTPPNNFLGIGSNPAIFVNEKTYKLLGKYHRTWEKNKTIAVQEDFLDKPPMKVIGILVHETGHAFNIAAGISNTEANACIFEIEVLSLWYKTNNSTLFDCSKEDLLSYFEERLTNYRSVMDENEYLKNLVRDIREHTILDESECRPRPVKVRKTRHPSRYELCLPSYLEISALILFKGKHALTLPTASLEDKIEYDVEKTKRRCSLL
ncbi:hypothetical protein [Legionella nagasakiensis]|uniref:hypothetical protein n=1 Tax=Legionella nagasakiensis TaxID=535290 RepID=UPI001055EDE1|nr:hypothetical protein [Legionella nagasakiensis]